MPFPNKTFATNNQIAIDAGRKGGSVQSARKKYAWRLMGLKKKAALSEADVKWFCECFEEPEANIIGMKSDLEELKDRLPAERYMALQGMIHKLAHGEKRTNVNVNVDYNQMIEHAYVDRQNRKGREQAEVIDVTPKDED